MFYEPSLDQLTYLIWVLMRFEVILGLRVNLEKNKLMPVRRVENIRELAHKFGCKVGALPSTYLGLPLGVPSNSIAVWDGVDERFWKKLTLWKRQYISKGGKLTLICSTLSSFAIYFMSLFCMPRSVGLRLEQIQRDFLKEWGALERKLHLVSWFIVCLDKSKGGLGVRNLLLLNRSLLCKWNWRFAKEKGAF